MWVNRSIRMDKTFEDSTVVKHVSGCLRVDKNFVFGRVLLEEGFRSGTEHGTCCCGWFLLYRGGSVTVFCQQSPVCVCVKTVTVVTSFQRRCRTTSGFVIEADV